MNIACIACGAVYAITGDELAGRKARVVCRRCSQRMLLDATGEQPTLGPETTGHASDKFLVSFAPDRQEWTTVADIVEAFGQGQLATRSFAWSKGMSEWRTLFEIEIIAAELGLAGYVPVLTPDNDDEEVPETRIAVPTPADNEATHFMKRPNLSVTGEDEDEATHVFRADEAGMSAEEAIKASQAAEDDVTIEMDAAAAAAAVAAATERKPGEETDSATRVFVARPANIDYESATQILVAPDQEHDSATRVMVADAKPPPLPAEAKRWRKKIPPPVKAFSAISVHSVAAPASSRSGTPTVNTRSSAAKKRRRPLLVVCSLLLVASSAALVGMYVTGNWRLVAGATADVSERLTFVLLR